MGTKANLLMRGLFTNSISTELGGGAPATPRGPIWRLLYHQYGEHEYLQPLPQQGAVYEEVMTSTKSTLELPGEFFPPSQHPPAFQIQLLQSENPFDPETVAETFASAPFVEENEQTKLLGYPDR